MKKSRQKTSIVWTTSKENMQKLLDESSSIVEILKKLGFDGYNGNHRTLVQRINGGEFDLSEFNKNKDLFQKSKIPLPKISNDEIFKKNSNYRRQGIKEKLLTDFNFDYKCAECGICDSYNGKPISLQLDHINGINNDNRIENLRFLCPNCHSQTETFSGKRHRKEYLCDCGNKIIKNSIHCISCQPTKIVWPDPKELQKILWEKPTTKISKELGVSDKAIDKFCKKNNLTKPPRGFWSKRAP